MNMERIPYTATTEEVAEAFSVTKATVRAWVNKKHIPRNSYLKAGATYRFNIDLIYTALTTDEADAEKPKALNPDPTWQAELASGVLTPGELFGLTSSENRGEAVDDEPEVMGDPENNWDDIDPTPTDEALDADQ